MTAEINPVRTNQPRFVLNGFTLVEVMAVLVILSLLALLAYPAYQSVVLKSRRSEALASLLTLRSAQERFHSQHGRYARGAELPITFSAHYDFQIVQADANGFSAQAIAKGGQASDGVCKLLQLRVEALNTLYQSGANQSLTNQAPVNRTCWSQ
jgi:type IV pilus assembly protein PilE